MIQWPAPAKINRFLHIVGRRPDGYHLLQTIFQFLDWGDVLTFTPRSDGHIVRQPAILGLPTADDLVIRAASLLQTATGIQQGVTIHLDKRLPLGGGLGGGSSDAATTLVALNHHWRAGLSTAELMTLGLQLGADVPVFIKGQAAWAEGIGEQLTPLDTLDEPWLVVIQPFCTVATRLIFQDPLLTRDTQLITMHHFMAGHTRNDCEAVVYRRYPEVAAAAQWLGQYGEARMTGTGACVFAAFATRADAQAVAARCPPRFKRFVARGLNRSPLYEVLSDASSFEQ